jgi:hypothetical protein
MTVYKIVDFTAATTVSNTEDTFVEIFPPSGVAVAIIRVKCAQRGTAQIDGPIRLRIVRTTTAGATGTSFTVKDSRPAGSAPVSSVICKSLGTTFTVGTVTDVLIDVSFNGRASFQWMARDRNDKLWSNENERICVLASCNDASARNLHVEVDFEE